MPAPDFTSLVKKAIRLPFDTKTFLEFTFSDPALAGYQVIVIEDSLPQGQEPSASNRLTTIVGRFYRGVLAEINTHRVFGRNSASSRARSVQSTIKEVMTNPYVPVWTVNRRGMSGEFASAATAAEATRLHLLGRDKAVATVLSLLVGPEIFDGRSDSAIAADYEAILAHYYENIYDGKGETKNGGLSLHKQAVNRGLEPYLFHEAIITSSYWSNFLELRNHDEADPAIRAFAVLLQAALEESVPEERIAHMPFIPTDSRPETFEGLEDFTHLRNTFLVSATECAQISYRDKSSAEKSTATTGLGERLLAMKHLSPFEHQAFARREYFEELAPTQGLPLEEKELRSNLSEDWVQLRPVLAGITR